MTSKQPSVKKLIEYLNHMESADEVADYLRREGIKGLPRDIHRCPISVLINRGRERSRYTYAASRTYVNIVYKSSNDWVSRFIPLPPAVIDFIARFDDGAFSHYSDLRATS